MREAFAVIACVVLVGLVAASCTADLVAADRCWDVAADACAD